jgi:hypothetical protein
VNGYLMQGVLVFANTTARDAAITAPAEGQFAFTKDTDSLWYYSGSAWVASGATGDIEGVTAGTGISGGGTSGTVTITNSMATAIDAKGDLIVGTGADTFSKLTAGTNTYVLTADSAEATGLKWAAPSGGGSTYVGATVYADNVFQAVSDSTLTAIEFPSEDWDTDGFHSTSSNTSRITIPTGKGGKYQITAAAFLSASITGQMNLRIYKNGSAITGTGLQNGMFAFQYANSDKISGTCTVSGVATDYFEVFIIHTAAGGSKDIRYARLSADYLGA